MSRGDELAARSWAHLRAARANTRDRLPDRLDDPGLLGAVPSLAAAVRAAAEDLPGRLVDGNLGAALAGHVVAIQHQRPELDAATILAEVLEAAGGHVPAVIEVRRLRRGPDSTVYYRRRNCCLRDRVTDRHRCDTCSLRPPQELDELVERSIAARHDEQRR